MLTQYIRYRVISLCLLFAVSSWAYADNAINQLSQLLRAFTTYQAQFSQVTYSEQGQVIQTSHGQVMIKRPGMFRWQTEKPMQQLLLTDGKQLWIYDADLAQVTQQMLSTHRTVDPAMLLSGNVKDLQALFRVVFSSVKTAAVFVLVPRKNNLAFKQIKLTFEQGRLVSMRVINNLGQTSEFKFSKIKLDQPLADRLFIFKVPTGVDVISP